MRVTCQQSLVKTLEDTMLLKTSAKLWWCYGSSAGWITRHKGVEGARDTRCRCSLLGMMPRCRAIALDILGRLASGVRTGALDTGGLA